MERMASKLWNRCNAGFPIEPSEPAEILAGGRELLLLQQMPQRMDFGAADWRSAMDPGLEALDEVLYLSFGFFRGHDDGIRSGSSLLPSRRPTTVRLEAHLVKGAP